MQLAEVDNAKEFADLIGSEEYEFRFHCGITKTSARIQFADRDKVVSAMSLHYTVLVSLAELEQLRRRLSIQKFSSLMETFPDILRTTFEPPERQITSDFLQDLFVATLSESGSNRREKEEAVLMAWIHYLQQIEGKSDSESKQQSHSHQLEASNSCPG